MSRILLRIAPETVSIQILFITVHFTQSTSGKICLQINIHIANKFMWYLIYIAYYINLFLFLLLFIVENLKCDKTESPFALGEPRPIISSFNNRICTVS